MKKGFIASLAGMMFLAAFSLVLLSGPTLPSSADAEQPSHASENAGQDSGDTEQNAGSMGQDSGAAKAASEVPVPSPLLSCRYFSEKDFLASIQEAQEVKTAEGIPAAGIVPHHLLAGKMIAQFFRAASLSKPETIVIIAPNHKRTGRFRLTTGDWSWQTAYGRVEADKDIVGYLSAKKDAGMNFDLLEQEHSISGLVPYIRYYLPSAEIVPVLLFGNYGKEESLKLGKELAGKLKGRKSLIIASIDFSHYLPPEKAEKMDKDTWKAILAMDADTISRMGNDNLDSPPSLITLLSYVGNIKKKPVPTLLSHSSSSSIAGKWSSSTTSYFTLLYY